MSASRIRLSLATMISPHRYTVFLIFGLVFVVSSFSALLPTCSTTNQNQNRNGFSSLNLVSQQCQQEQQHRRRTFYQPTASRSPLILSMASSATAEDTQEARDLFSKYCDKNSLIDRKTLESIPPFADMLADEDILPVELNEIWEAAPKSSDDSSRVDVISFVQIYRDVDDMFEEDDNDEEQEGSDDDDGSSETSAVETETEIAADANDNGIDEELSKAYKSICDDSGLVSKDKMKQWEEIENLLAEGLLGEDEFDELWKNAANEENDSLDADGFLNFNNGLDDLFVVEDDDDDDESEESSATTNCPKAMVIEGDDMPPGVLFSQLADKNYLVGMKELNLWTELKDLLEDGELLPSELQEMYDKFVTPESSGKLSEDGFLQLYDEIDGLFEEDDDTEEKAASAVPQQQQSPPMNKKVKEDLLSFIEIIKEDDDEPCGFGATESDQGQVLNIVKILEQQPANMILQKEGNIELADLTGNWELVYTSSSAMKFNNGLSGIGGSIPNGKFGGVKQELIATNFVSDMFYKERIEVIPSSASFDVTVNGSWDLRKSISLFTGQPTVILNVEPYKVTYGPTSTRADHWKSLGPTNRLDLSYLDDDLRVMRGCTSADTLFVFQKIQ